MSACSTPAAPAAPTSARCCGRWQAQLPPEWQLDEDHAVTPVRGAGLPMALHRQPAYTRGLLLVGDAAGAVNPFNGEGISYAMETGLMAAEAAAAALAAPEGPAREELLRRYPARLREAYGHHHRLGTVFLALLARPDLVRFATAHGLKRPALRLRRAAAHGQPERRPRRGPLRPRRRRPQPPDPGGLSMRHVTVRDLSVTQLTVGCR